MVSLKKTAPNPSNCIAVVDIGSNSVRLVLYTRVGKRYERIQDKKATCRLALGMQHDHPRLNPQGMKLALQALRDFKGIIQKSGASRVFAVATAAMRAVAKTAEGQSFHRKAETALGHEIKIISGRKEARLTAYGVMTFLPRAVGICGDLGGGSLELAAIDHGGVLHASTVSIGTLTLPGETRGDLASAEKLVNKRVRHVAWLKKAQGKTFYAIGGSWRAVGRIMMKNLGLPSRSVHGFKIKAALAHAYAVDIARQKPAAFRQMSPGIRRRAEVIPSAAVTLAQLITLIKPRQIVFSGHGVREGIVSQQAGKNAGKI